MANGGILELDPTTITGTDAAAFAQTPEGIMLNQQLARQELLAQQGGGGPASQAAMNPTIRAQGVTSANVRPGMQQQPMGFQGGDMAQIYGLMAGYADDPTQVGQNYVRAVQQQQALDRQNQPIEQYLRLYGNINPHDFEADSIERFHNHYVQTGEMKHGLLVRREDLSTKEQDILNTAITTAQKAEVDMARMANIADRFRNFAAQGVAQGRFFGGLTEWWKGMGGTEDELTQLRTEYEQIMASGVLDALPPGVASDRDIEIARRGWPQGVADPNYIAEFLGAMTRLQAARHAQATHAASYLSQHRSQQGQLEDWERNKRLYIDAAYERYAPQNYSLQGGFSLPGYGDDFGAPQGGGAGGTMGGGAPAPQAQYGVNPTTGEPFGSQEEMVRFWANPNLGGTN